MQTVIINAHVISPGVNIENATITIDKGKIAAVTKQKGVAKLSTFNSKFSTCLDAAGALVVPGFIDVHLHGASGYDVCDDAPEAIEAIARAKLAEGCTTFLPTTLTVDHETLMTAAKNVAAYQKSWSSTCGGARALGLHLEGPFINPKCCGAQNPAFVRKPDMKEVIAIDRVAPVKMVSFAPEMPGGPAFAAACLKRGIVPSCGHTAATFTELEKAYQKGLRHLTHFCNQMSKLHHREIGVVGAGFLVGDLNTELICDRIHLCDDMLRLVFARRPLEHIQMITDSLRCSHMKDGYSFEMGGLKVRLEKGEARLVEGGNLAGSTLWLNKGLKNLRDVTGLPLEDLIRVTSYNQAIELGLGDTLGRVAKGYTADLALLDPKTFNVKLTIISGNLTK